MKKINKKIIAALVVVLALITGLLINKLHEPTLEELYEEAEGTMMHSFVGTELKNATDMDIIEEEDRYVIHIHFTEEDFANVTEEDWDHIVESLQDSSKLWREVLDREGRNRKLEFRIGTPDEQHIYLSIVDGEVIINDMDFD